MSAEARFSVIHPKLSRSGGEIIAGAVSYSVDQGSPLATVEGLFISLVTHPRVSPAARLIGIEPDFLDLARGARPVAEGATLLWDGEVQRVIEHAHDFAQDRGARKAGIIDLLQASSRHDYVRDLFIITPAKLNDLDRLPFVLRSYRQNPWRKDLAS